MTLSLFFTKKQIKEAYDGIFAKMKAKGLSDRDADIIALSKLHEREAPVAMAEKHGMTKEEVEKVYRSYYGNRLSQRLTAI